MNRYLRQLALPQVGEAGQARLAAGRVLLVGVGGLGSPCALYLAAAGVGRLGVLDADRVEESNLHRQVLFDTGAIGEHKALAAEQRLRALNPLIDVRAHAVELCASNVTELFADYDLIVDGSDRVATRYLVNDACVLLGKALVSAAVHRFEGQAMTYVPGRGPCYRCLFPAIDAAAVASCEAAGILGVLPGLLGLIQATETLKYLLGVGELLLGRLLTVDALAMRFEAFAYERRRDCAVCGEAPTIRSLVDPPGFCSQAELAAVEGIGPRALAARLAREPALRLIDVREPSEFERGSVARAVSLPLALLERADGAAVLPPAPLVFLCRSGVRSRRAAALARRAGHRAVWQLEGGLLAWREQVDPRLVF